MLIEFNVTCEYIHCFGKHRVELGVVETEAEARDWQQQLQHSAKKPSLSADDPIRTCPVVRCPLKKQTPRYGYEKVTG